ncbi:hypothetical protein [Rhodococcoides kyotonense]|uniref:hypothetical protein n=1 Tax=Rhodococcoides kyotonense TaxID=398843 RepID=UPI0011306320|nr:hypothetical protein [Rhodococcus kyotonensis]
MTPFGMQVVVGIVAILSFLLGVYNFWYAKKAPVRERQRELEDQVRVELEDLSAAYQRALTAIRNGRFEDSAVPDTVNQGKSSLKSLAGRLADVGLRIKLTHVADWTSIVAGQWFDVALHNEYPKQRTDKQAAAAEAKLLELLKEQSPKVTEILRILDDKDRGGTDRGYIP